MRQERRADAVVERRAGREQRVGGTRAPLGRAVHGALQGALQGALHGAVRRGARRARVVAGAGLLTLVTTSAAPMSRFVASGEYARGRALAANCGAPFFPVLDPRARESAGLDDLVLGPDATSGAWEALAARTPRVLGAPPPPVYGDRVVAEGRSDGRSDGGLEEVGPDAAGAGTAVGVATRAGDPSEAGGASRWQLASLRDGARRVLRQVRFERPDASLEYHYRTEAMIAAAHRVEPDTLYAFAEWNGLRRVSRGAGPLALGETRLDSYELAERSLTVASTMTAQGCTRIVIQVTPAVLQVGMRAGSVVTRGAWEDLPPVLGRGSTVTIPAINPVNNRGRVTVKLYENGVPVPNREVVLWTDSRGQPGRYGSTVGHEHVVRSAPAPSILVQGQSTRGARVKFVTDGNGEHSFWVQPGYRGGPEALFATATLGGTAQTASRAIVVRHKIFVDFKETFGFTGRNPATPGPAFPFVLTGSTAASRHVFNHYMQAGRAEQIRNALLAVYEQDPRRKAAGPAHYWILNDESTEYGGVFRHASTDCDDPTSAGGHKTHNVGLDFDIVPCWSNGAATVNGAMCESGVGIPVSQRILAMRVIGDLGGAILLHSPAFDATPYHFHVRFPQAD